MPAGWASKASCRRGSAHPAAAAGPRLDQVEESGRPGGEARGGGGSGQAITRRDLARDDRIGLPGIAAASKHFGIAKSGGGPTPPLFVGIITPTTLNSQL